MLTCTARLLTTPGTVVVMSHEDVLAREAAIAHLDGQLPVFLEPVFLAPCGKDECRSHPGDTGYQEFLRDQAKPKRKRAARLTPEEKLARAEARRIERERVKREKAELKAREKEAQRLQKIQAAEGGRISLPAIVLRDGTVKTIPATDAFELLRLTLDELCLDVETSGYWIGHKLYELRTIQLGCASYAIVLDAASDIQLLLAKWALNSAAKLRAHSAGADLIPCVEAGLISWDDGWGKMHDSVLAAKLTDPSLSGSDAEGLKDLERDLFGADAVAHDAEAAKNELFKALGCLIQTDATTPVEKNGWYQVSKFAVTMIRYAGSDVLALGAVVKKLDPMIPVSDEVMERERLMEAKCAKVAQVGFHLNHGHVKAMIAQHEASRTNLRAVVEFMSRGLITNPSSPDVGEKLIELYPELVNSLEVSVKTGRPSAAKASLEKVKKDYPIAKAILDYRHDVTTLGLLLRPLENLCEQGDGRMRPTVYTINADTGRTSCVRPNGQQFSRQGRVRECVDADPGFLGIAADFSGCEIRVAAGLSGDRELLLAETSPQCYACGHDPCACGMEHKGLHWMAAHEAFGPAATKEHRYWCKRGIFCKLFGGGPETAARQVYCDVDSMRRVFEAFETLAPTYTAWDKWLRKCFYDGSTVWRDFTTGTNYSQPLDGRRRGVYRTYSGRNIYVQAPHAFGNYAIQGTARELLVDGILRWDKGPWRDYPLLPIHDEILAFVPAGEAQAAVSFLQQCMATDVLSSPGFEVHIDADPDEPFQFWPDSS